MNVTRAWAAALVMGLAVAGVVRAHDEDGAPKNLKVLPKDISHQELMATMRGFLKVELLREAQQPSQYQMVIRFESAEASAEWRGSAIHQSLQPVLKSLYSESKLQVYDVVA